jgi:hypothetical protein
MIARLAIVCWLLANVAGCFSGDQPAYPVEFKVFVKGKPAVGATVVLHPAGNLENPIKPSGKVDDTGTVRLSSFGEGDGAPAGDYRVTIVWFDITSSSEQAVIIKGDDKLKGRYSRPDTPTAPRITVQKQTNQLPPLDL